MFNLQVPEAFAPIIFEVKKEAPSILMGAGIASVVIATISACKATLQAAPVFEQHGMDVKEARKRVDEDDDYTKSDLGRDLTAIYKRTCCKLVGLYTPAAIMMTIGISCICSSNYILSERNIALATAYGTVNSAFKQYRDRVVEDLGEEKDRQYRTGEKEVTIEEVVDGKKKKKKVKVADPNSIGSGYMKYFTPNNPNWNDVCGMNYHWLKGQEQYFNHILNTKGYVTVAQVWERLDLDKGVLNPDALQNGWTYKNHDVVDFGLGNGTVDPVINILDNSGRPMEAYAIDLNPCTNVYESLCEEYKSAA